MKIAILSDLHLEQCSGIYDVNTLPEADIMLLAGDICTVRSLNVGKGYRNFFEHLSAKYKRTYYIPGNHEFYGSDIEHARKELFKYFYEYNNIIFSDGGSNHFEFDGMKIKVILTPLWTNFADNDDLCKSVALQGINDFRTIRWHNTHITPDDMIKLFNSSVSLINAVCENYDTDKTIVLTHWTPSTKSIHPRWGNDPLNRYFSNNLELSLINKADLWVHGHTHDAFDYYINNTRIVCNPGGYSGENTGFDPKKVIEL